MQSLNDILSFELTALRSAGTYKEAVELQSPQAARVRMNGRDILNFSSNNYLGLADRPEVIAGAKKAVDEYGSGTASVRFICGTTTLHRQLEKQIASFLNMEAALTYLSCWDANLGLIPTLAATEQDAVFSDALNHASIIDAIRLSKAKRFIYPHSDLAALEKMLQEGKDARVKLLITDGVFSMEGDVAKLPELVALAEKYGAAVVVDESHATGVLGKTGRGTVEHFGFDPSKSSVPFIQTSTLGKTLGGACGGYVAGSQVVIDYLIQRSRPSLFSNALPPAVLGASSAALSLLQKHPELLDKLRANTKRFRAGMEKLKFDVRAGITPICPVIVGDAALANQMQKALFAEGIFVSGFGFPVVPKGEARLRCQISAAHTDEQIDKALAAFQKVGRQFKLIS
jgi:glycine C-acetyltransferase